MKDLLVYTADADAQAVMKSVLARRQSLGIRAITFDVERHPLRDSGMVQTGAALARMKKGHYAKALLLWDHHGSGVDRRMTPEQSAIDMQAQLDRATWQHQSMAVVLVPELEEWLWHNPVSLATHMGITVQQLAEWEQIYAERFRRDRSTIRRERPKELFEFVMRDKLKRTISPRDFEQIARRASLKDWRHSASFQRIADTL